ncbi:ribonuclease H-like domain-containing protein, partial [Tanacetum coccineum]
LYSLDKYQFIFSRDVKFFENIFPFKDLVVKKNDSINVFQDVNHINFFDIGYPKIPNDDESIDNNLNRDQKSQSDSSSSFVSGSNVNTADFPVDNPGNDANSSDNFVATQNEEVATLEENIFLKDRYKARLVTHGFGQKEEIDYEETFSPVVKMVNVRCLLNIAVSMCFLVLLVYVDDIIITNNSVSEIEKFKVYLKSKFMIKDLGKLKYFLGIEVVDVEKGICLNQRKYVLDLLFEYGMLACKPAKTPLVSKLVISNEACEKDHLLDNITDYQKLMGKLIYLTNTRPDISYVVHCLSQFMHFHLKSHLKIAFKILRYFKSCPGLGIHIVKTSGMFLNAYSDADWAKCVITKKSVTGYCVFLNDSLVSWKIKKQSTLSKSLTEAEYRALALVISESIQIRALLGAQDVWELVETGYTEPVSAATLVGNELKVLKETRKKDKTTLYLLFKAVDESGFEKITGAKTFKEARDILERESSKELNVLTIDELAGSLEAYEQRCGRGGHGNDRVVQGHGQESVFDEIEITNEDQERPEKKSSKKILKNQMKAEEKITIMLLAPPLVAITPPPLCESSSDIEAPAPIVADGALEVLPAGDDIEAYNNRFHELVLMCPTSVPNENEKCFESEQAVQRKAARQWQERTPQAHVSKTKEPAERGSSCESLRGGHRTLFRPRDQNRFVTNADSSSMYSLEWIVVIPPELSIVVMKRLSYSPSECMILKSREDRKRIPNSTS